MNAAADTVNPVADILDKAADIIERQGWTQGDWYQELPVPPEDCPVCAGGGINVATDHAPDDDGYTYDERDEAFRAFAHHVDPDQANKSEEGDYLDAWISAIGEWNDDPERTIEQVVAALRACAANLRTGACAA